MFRILSWEDGDFELLGPEPHNFPEQINMPTEHLLMEGLRQLDELRHQQAKLPPMDTRLKVEIPVPRRLADMEDQHMDVYQIVLESPTVQEVLDRIEMSDNDSAIALQFLIKKGYVCPDDDSFL